MRSESHRDLHMCLRCPFLLLYWDKVRHTLKSLQLCRSQFESLADKKNLCAAWQCMLKCWKIMEINQQLIPTGSSRHKDYLSAKTHKTPSFSFLKCLYFCSRAFAVPPCRLDHAHSGLKRGIWQTLCRWLAASDPAGKRVFPMAGWRGWQLWYVAASERAERASARCFST